MSEPLILDTNILADVSRGNTLVADALNRYIRSGTTVYISRAAYDELVTRAPNAQMSGQYREMLSDLRIQIAPSGPMATRVGVYSDNIQINPAPGQPGQIREYDRKNDPTKPGDVFVAAQAKAIDARLWTLDTDIIKRAPQLGVKLAPECATIRGINGTESPDAGRQLLGLNPKAIGVDGRVLPAPATSGVGGAYQIPPPPPSQTGGGKTGGGGGGTKASVGVADNTPIIPGGPSPDGMAKIGGIRLAFQGINFVLNLINDYIQKKKVEEALANIDAQMTASRTANPQKGVLLLFYYMQFEAPPDSLIKPGAAFNYLIYGMGVTRDEAMEDAFRTPSISQGPGPNERKFSQSVWVPPLQKSVITTARCPFPPVGICNFALVDGKKAKFQLVEFNVIGGFDDNVEKSLEIDGANPEFAILKPPSSVSWFNINGRQNVSVPLKQKTTANGKSVTVVDLDPYSPFNASAAMCFPVDEWSEKVFNAVNDTDGGRILAYTNFSMIRWIRAENMNWLRAL